MSTIFRARKKANDDSRSGGKIVRGRRLPDARSPYARITANENPNRFRGFLSPASRMITGAAKMISTVFFPITPPTSSSSEDYSGDDDISSQEGDRGKQLVATSEADNYELQLTAQKSENKLAIEQLIMQETFSRAECNELVNMIESRVVEFPANKEGWDARRRALAFQSDCQGIESPAICDAAVMEAIKWVEEKKTESCSQLDKSQGTFTSNQSMLSNVAEGEGSPVLVAKSYMKSRPPWASPTIGHVGFQKSSPIAMYPLNKETRYSAGAHALSSAKDSRRSSLGIDSWNSPDDLRRVQFKSAEDTMQPLSGKKYDSTSPHLAADLSKSNGLSEGNNGSGHENNQDLEGVQITVNEGETTQIDGNLVSEIQDDSQSQEEHAKKTEVNRSSVEVVANGFSSASSLPARMNGDSSLRPSNGGAKKSVTSSDGKLEGSCEILSEASLEIPDNDDVDNIASGSINSSSRQSKELLQKETPAVSSPVTRKRSSTTTTARAEKQVVKKVGRYSKRGRGRGK